MDGIIAYALSRAFTKKTVVGMGALKGAPCKITSIVDNLDGTHDITFSWKDDSDVTHTSVLTVEDGETPSFSSVVITGGHRLTFTTQDPTQSVSFDVMDGAKGDTGVSVVASNVDENNNLTLTLSNGNVINAGKIKAVTVVDNTLSTTSTNPVENKVITNALNDKVDKEMGKGLFSDEEKTKLENIEDGAQVNVLEKLIVNGQEATITDKSITLTLITSAVSNLQNYYLKTETYTKQEVEDLIGQTVGVTIEIVEQLPTEGQSNVIYFLPTETEGVYSQYIYTTDGWILIGSTTVDLSNYYTKTQIDTLLNGKQNVLTIDSFPTALSNNPVASGGVYTAIAQMQPQFQFSNMPTASASNLGFVYQYIGATGTYTQNMFYRCVYDSILGEYKWEEVIFHAVVTVDSELSPTSTNPVQNKVVKEALDTKQDIMQYSTMPSAQDNLGKIVQYIGTNTANYTNGYFYKAVYDSESDVYLWTVIKFSADMLVDSALSTTSENPVQNKVITGAINDIQGVIPSEASSTNKLVDRDSLGTASQKDFTPYISPDNTDVPISSSVYSAITSAVYGAYHPSGSKTIAELTSDLLVLANIGNVYKITEDGVTTDLFIGGAGQTIHTGDNAVVVYGGTLNTFLFDLQSGSIDLTPYQTKALTTSVVGETTVEGALSGLDTKETDDIKDVYEVMGRNGAKNLNSYPYQDTSRTTNGITFTDLGDGTIKANGTATADAYFSCHSRAQRERNDLIIPNGRYILSGCPSGGGTSTYNMMAQRTYNGNVDLLGRDSGDGVLFVANGDDFSANEVSIQINIFIKSGQTVSNLIFKPMLRYAEDTDNTYIPYVPTNRELVSWRANNKLGAKNILRYPYSDTTKTVNGITFTDNGDGTITADGTATALAQFVIIPRNSSGNFTLANGTYTFNGCPTGGSNDSYRLNWSNSIDDNVGSDYGDGCIVSVTNSQAYYGFFISIANGATVSNLVFKPMLRLVEDTDDTYAPYSKTNRELTIDKAEQAEVNDIVNVYGAKNVLRFPYSYSTRTIEGITYTVNDDGTITANGTSTGISIFRCSIRKDATVEGDFFIPNGNYILSGCTGGATSPATYDLRCVVTKNNEAVVLAINTNGDTPFTVDGDDFSQYGANPTIQIIIRSGITVTNLVFKPMIRLASVNDNTYQPYAMTNQQMTPYVQAISNPNLFDNSWFTVNQRALTTYTTPTSGRKYTVDRWSINTHLSATVDSNGITLTSDDSGINGDLEHKFENMYPFLINRLVTLSVKLSDGKIYSTSGIIDPNKVGTIRLTLKDGWKMDINTGSTNSTISGYIYSGTNNLNSSITVRAVKLELGGVSTLAMDTAPNYASELLKCQRYFERIGGTAQQMFGSGIYESTTQFTIYAKIQPKRVAPTATLSGTVYCWDSTHIGVSGLQATSMPVAQVGKDGNGRLSFTVSGGVTGQVGMAQFRDTTSHIDFSADM